MLRTRSLVLLCCPLVVAYGVPHSAADNAVFGFLTIDVYMLCIGAWQGVPGDQSLVVVRDVAQIVCLQLQLQKQIAWCEPQ
jgi:hypothetical protein